VGGNIGNGDITIRMLTERTAQDVGNDGVVMPSYVAGQNAEVTVSMQQTSQLHKQFLALINLLTTAADGGDVSGWAGTTMSLRTILDGSGHNLTGVTFQKIPDKSYAAHGQKLVWVLLACSAVNQ
jgi:hypothetical protein